MACLDLHDNSNSPCSYHALAIRAIKVLWEYWKMVRWMDDSRGFLRVTLKHPPGWAGHYFTMPRDLTLSRN